MLFDYDYLSYLCFTHFPIPVYYYILICLAGIVASNGPITIYLYIHGIAIYIH